MHLGFETEKRRWMKVADSVFLMNIFLIKHDNLNQLECTMLHVQKPFVVQIFDLDFRIVCQKYGTMVDTKPPDLILDTSSTGPASLAVKSIAKAFAIPTLSLTYDNKKENE